MEYQVRQPAVAGIFYPGTRSVLSAEINSLLDSASPETGSQSSQHPVPKAIIVPHAGYIYSGSIAASAFSLLKAASDTISRVILLGPTHRVAVRGIALPGDEIFVTPLGRIPVDEGAAESIRHLPQVVERRDVHADEHSLEVQLPFLQSVLSDFSILPLAVGDTSPEEVAEVLDILWGGDETLIVVSSDLSHYLSYQEARMVDSETVQDIVELRGPVSHQQACGGTPVNGLILSARRHHLSPKLLDMRNSGDTAGDRSRVVGYASFAFNRLQSS